MVIWLYVILCPIICFEALLSMNTYFTPFCEALRSTVVTSMTSCDIHVHKSRGVTLVFFFFGAYHTRLKNIENVKGCRDGMPKSM